MNLHEFFYPRGVAVVGSASEGKLGYYLIQQLLAGGYGNVFAVNPKASGVSSVRGYSTIAGIEKPVDLAIIASPAATVTGVLEDCGRAAVGSAVIISAGFSEIGNGVGEAEVVKAAKRSGVRFFGPNCAGILNTSHRLFPTLETKPPAGTVALVAQSGAVGGILLAWAKERRLGISKFVSYGNGADLNEVDLLRYLATDSETEAVALYLESVNEGREFMHALRECVEQKPVIVIKAGRTRSGQRAALSHTGSMAGSDAVYDAMLRQCGALRVHTVEEMFDFCKAYTRLPQLEGRRVAIVTNSGGPGVMAADRAEEVGLELSDPSLESKARLSEFLPPSCALRNPIDLTVEGTENGYRRSLQTLLEDYDAAVALNIAPPYLDSLPLARGVCDAAGEAGKPVLASFLPGQIVADAINYVEEHGVPNFATGERAVAALARMTDYLNGKKQLRRPPQAPQERLPLPVDGQMLEPDAMAWLRENGIPVPKFRVAANRTEAVKRSGEIGYPVAMKVVSPLILHKSDCGGVIINIEDDETAAGSFVAIERAAAGRDFRGVVIYPMIRDAHELLIGLSRDPQFGPVVAFGMGGVYTEVWHDLALRVAPLDQQEAHAMIRETRCYPLLEGSRGQERSDVKALADVLVSVSRLPFQYPEVGQMDLNPVFVQSRGVLVGDVRVIRTQS